MTPTQRQWLFALNGGDFAYWEPKVLAMIFKVKRVDRITTALKWLVRRGFAKRRGPCYRITADGKRAAAILHMDAVDASAPKDV